MKLSPVGHFLMDGHNLSHRMYRKANAGGIELYVSEDIPSKQIWFKTMIKVKNTVLLESISESENS